MREYINTTTIINGKNQKINIAFSFKNKKFIFKNKEELEYVKNALMSDKNTDLKDKFLKLFKSKSKYRYLMIEEGRLKKDFYTNFYDRNSFSSEIDFVKKIKPYLETLINKLSEREFSEKNISDCLTAYLVYKYFLLFDSKITDVHITCICNKIQSSIDYKISKFSDVDFSKFSNVEKKLIAKQLKISYKNLSDIPYKLINKKNKKSMSEILFKKSTNHIVEALKNNKKLKEEKVKFNPIIKDDYSFFKENSSPYNSPKFRTDWGIMVVEGFKNLLRHLEFGAMEDTAKKDKSNTGYQDKLIEKVKMSIQNGHIMRAIVTEKNNKFPAIIEGLTCEQQNLYKEFLDNLIVIPNGNNIFKIMDVIYWAIYDYMEDLGLESCMPDNTFELFEN